MDGSLVGGIEGPVQLGELIEALEDTYCRSIGVEFMHIDSLDIRTLAGERMEPVRNRFPFGLQQKYRTLITLHQAELFERFLHTKYVGQKRFSLEGGETLIPILDAIIEKGPALGVKEFVIGMAHRGRLNVLANTLDKPFAEIFSEFEDNYLPQSTTDGDGDVKYHLGFSADVETSEGKTVHLSLAPNPSHLEIVELGGGGPRPRQAAPPRRRRAQDRRADADPRRRRLRGAGRRHGELQPDEPGRLQDRRHHPHHRQQPDRLHDQPARLPARRQYCTDIAKFVQAPIFHVNAEDPEACVAIAQLAMEFRQEFKRDVVIDMVCYRKWGHNEGDNPAYTQPLQSKVIEKKKPLSQVYAARLAEEEGHGVTANVSEAIGEAFEEKLAEALGVADNAAAEYRARLERAHADVKAMVKKGEARKRGMQGFTGRWKGFTNRYTHDPVATAVPEATIDRIADALGTFPEGFTVHPNLLKVLQSRRDKSAIARAWTGAPARRSPSARWSSRERRCVSPARTAAAAPSPSGTRWWSTSTPAPSTSLSRTSIPKQAPFEVHDSSLSEAAVMGFEYGYSLDDPASLVMWEAQFGDFANGAQVIIDQFLTSGESKWNRSSGLVLLLPHAYEGQGPEHSSARLERFLQMCAEDNIQVVYPTTPAQYFHLLRRQVKRNFRKPLVVMTPKSLLRLPAATSPVE